MSGVSRARSLRKKSTWAERRPWQLLRSRRLAGYKFRRQRIEGRFHPDFYCSESKLAVELDGWGHGIPEQRRFDQERDGFLANRGIFVVRIWNHQLAHWRDRENVIENLWRLLQERARHPDNMPRIYRPEPDKPSP